MKTSRVSKALDEVWKWKDACYQDVAHLPFREALRKRIEDAERVARGLGFVAVERNVRNQLAVAEDKAEYVTKGKKR